MVEMPSKSLLFDCSKRRPAKKVMGYEIGLNRLYSLVANTGFYKTTVSEIISFILYYLQLWYRYTIFAENLKNMSKYIISIQDKRFVSGKEMFSGIQNKETVSSLLYKYTKRNLVAKIRKNIYLPTNPADGFVYENKYEIGCSSVPLSYLSYHSAMAFYGWENQVFNRVYLSAPKRFRPFDFYFVDYMYAPHKFREGVVKDENRNIYYTELERTIIDCADRLDLAGGYEEYFYNLDFIEGVDEEKLLFYLSLYNKQALYQRAGFMLSRFQQQINLSDRFFAFCKEKIGKSTRYLTDKFESKIYIPEWKLYVPKYLLSLTENNYYETE